MRKLLTAVAIALATIAPACLNDRDSLADEARKNRDVLTTLVGGFERNPPLYYQMRIDRIKKELAANPKQLPLYDDIAVAYDRIGDDDHALQWIEKKRVLLPPMDSNNQEEWYRYYANAGTFWAHRWVKRGAKKDTVGEIIRGRELIGEALRIKPDAHFGREKYQFAVMSWLIYTRQQGPKPLGDYLREEGRRFVHTSSSRYDYADGLNKKDYEDAAIGLSGLIRLGGAWQSVDVYRALGTLFGYPEYALGEVARFRAEELEKAGAKSLDPGEEGHGEMGYVPLVDEDIQEYHRLRALADKWNADRQSFMIAKMKQGLHPDTDPHFWDGAPAMPEFKVHQSFNAYWSSHVATTGNIILFALAIVIGTPILLVVVIRRWLRKRRAGAQSATPL